MSFRRIILLVGLAFHVAVGVLAMTSLASYRQNRQADVEVVREQADVVHQETTNLRHHVQVQQAIRDGIAAEDPYVVELLARRQLGYHGGDREITPPPRSNDH